MPFTRWYYLAAGGFVTGMAYGCWAGTAAPPMPLWLLLLIGGFGIALALTATPLIWREPR